MKFLFSLPQLKRRLSHKASDAIAVAFLSDRLANEPRKRVAHTSGQAENVAEHSLMVAKVAVALAQKYYPNLDVGKVALYAICHDDIEAYVGDTPSGEWARTDYEAKEVLERQGRDQLVKEFGDILPAYAQTVIAYEEQTEPEARFVRVIDKLTVPLMHIADGGQAVNTYFTTETYVSNEEHRYSKMKDYDDWQEMLELMPEMADYVAKYLMKNDAS